MVERQTLPRSEALPTSLDYAALRDQAITHIQALSGEIWTDHNAHDPGITTLEILCYALTDLAYRTGFNTVDLLTHENGQLDTPDISGLFPAHEVLTTGPRTLNDYRRLLLRIDGLRNAWLDPMMDPMEPANYRLSEVPIFADCLADALSFNPIGADGELTHPVQISGLYKILVELEIDDLLGSMNETALTFQVRKGPLKGVILGFTCTDPTFVSGDLNLSKNITGIGPLNLSAHPLGFLGNITVTLEGGDLVTLTNCLVSVIEDRPRFDRPAINVTTSAVRSVLLASDSDDILPLFWLKQQRRAEALAKVRFALNAHRGLCEDYLSIETVAPFRVGLCGDIEVEPDADLEQVQAQVFRAVEAYLAPSIRYQTLSERLDDGQDGAEIFNGPFIDFDLQYRGQKLFTKPGFISDDALAGSELRRHVQASDIINLIVDIPGVTAVRGLLLRAYDDTGLAVGTSESWTLDIPPDHQGVFFAQASKLLFHKSGVPYRPQLTEFKRTLDYLRRQDQRDVYVPPDQILPIPHGKFREPGTAYSIQHDFPETYKIGKSGISSKEPHTRIAQARQFKAYLTMFDQFLADYLGQLSNLPKLYSLDKSINQTWFSPALSDIAGSLGDFTNEFFTDPAAMADPLTRARMNESESQFLERRNRLLDHLIARFAENFTDYAMMSFDLSGDRLKSSAGLIDDKIDFLSDYPLLSRNRGQASNMYPDKPALAWNSENISGLERRLARFLGIKDVMREDLNCSDHAFRLFETVGSGANTRLIIKDADGKTLFRSIQKFSSKAHALKAIIRFHSEIREEGRFDISSNSGATTWRIKLVVDGRTLSHRDKFDTQIDATQRVQAILARYDQLLASEICNGEGMHLIEHILLRPKAAGDPLLPVCLPEECTFCSEEDPYSFRASVILPYWPERFRNLHFRALLETTLRQEAPAHVQIKTCWINQAQMTLLDKAYRDWVQAEAARPQNPATVRNAKATLIEVLASLKTVYPTAELHDCDVGTDSNPVRLGATALGLF